MSQYTKPTLFSQVVTVTHGYLGPAAERFVVRQIHNHLHIEPEALQRRDLARLIDWIRIAVSFLTEDNQLVTAYIAELTKLMRQKS